MFTSRYEAVLLSFPFQFVVSIYFQMRATHSAHFILYIIPVIIFDEEHKMWSAWLCSFPQFLFYNHISIRTVT